MAFEVSNRMTAFHLPIKVLIVKPFIKLEFSKNILHPYFVKSINPISRKLRKSGRWKSEQIEMEMETFAQQNLVGEERDFQGFGRPAGIKFITWMMGSLLLLNFI
jgi:hypothetical protein